MVDLCESVECEDQPHHQQKCRHKNCSNRDCLRTTVFVLGNNKHDCEWDEVFLWCSFKAKFVILGSSRSYSVTIVAVRAFDFQGTFSTACTGSYTIWRGSNERPIWIDKQAWIANCQISVLLLNLLYITVLHWFLMPAPAGCLFAREAKQFRVTDNFH